MILVIIISSQIKVLIAMHCC